MVRRAPMIDVDRRHASSRGAAAFGAAAAGALAVGACAIGALAIGRLAVRKARIGNLEIGELSVRRLRRGELEEAFDAFSGGRATALATLANEYVALCRQGKFELAMDRVFSADHIRIESRDMAEPPNEVRGLAAIKKNSRGFSAHSRIERVDIDGPFLAERARFAVRFSIEAVSPSGERGTVRKLDLYTVRDGRIVRSEVYYNTPPLSTR